MKTIPVFTLRDLLLFKLSKWVVTYMLLSVHALAQPPELTPADIKAFQHTVIPLRNADTGSLDQDLEFLDEFVAGAKVVALGEPTHGAREAFLFKYRIIRYLVEEHGFNTIAMEANLPEARSVDSYINAGSGDGRSALGKLFGIWNTHEVLDLIEWLRRHNETSIQPVRFHGIDIQSPWSSAREVLEYLEGADSDLYVVAQELYASALALEHDWNPAALGRLAPALKRDAGLMLELLVGSLDGEGASADEDAAWALLNARAVVQLAESQYDNLTSRDQSMAENVQRLLKDPDARILLWAHNVHVIELVPSGSSSPGMGAYLDHALGEGYRSIAITFSYGESRAFDPTSDSWVTHQLPVIPGTVGAELRRLGSPAFFLDVRALRGESSFAWLSRQQSFRWTGWAASGTILSLVPTDAFDGLAFIEVISPARAIDRD